MDNTDELTDVERIQLKNEGILEDYEQGTAVLNLTEDTIVHLIPKCFIPKEKKYKKYYTEIVMKSGDVLFAVGKPENVYKQLNEYLDSFPIAPPGQLQ